MKRIKLRNFENGTFHHFLIAIVCHSPSQIPDYNCFWYNFPSFVLAVHSKYVICCLFQFQMIWYILKYFLPKIKSSADLRNNYNEISTFCHTYPEPIFITKNGKGDLAVMSIEAYERSEEHTSELQSQR